MYTVTVSQCLTALTSHVMHLRRRWLPTRERANRVLVVSDNRHARCDRAALTSTFRYIYYCLYYLFISGKSSRSKRSDCKLRLECTGYAASAHGQWLSPLLAVETPPSGTFMFANGEKYGEIAWYSC